MITQRCVLTRYTTGCAEGPAAPRPARTGGGPRTGGDHSRLALRRRGITPCYAGEKNLWECDFVTGDRAIQVCAELTPQNRKRELEGVARASQLPGKRRALILTLDQRDQLRELDTAVEVRPVWEWLLEP